VGSITSAVTFPGASTSARVSVGVSSPVISFFSTPRRITASRPSASTAAATTLPSASTWAANGPSGRFCGSRSRETAGVSSGLTTRWEPSKVTSKFIFLSSTRPSDVAAANALLCGGTVAARRVGPAGITPAAYTTLPSAIRTTRTSPAWSRVATWVR
jgi:hypothetical protein